MKATTMFAIEVAGSLLGLRCERNAAREHRLRPQNRLIQRVAQLMGPPNGQKGPSAAPFPMQVPPEPMIERAGTILFSSFSRSCSFLICTIDRNQTS